MSASGLHFIEFSLLLVFQVELQTAISQRHCDNLKASFPSCNNNNSVLRVTKSTEHYQLTLLATEWQCYGEFCLLNNQMYRQRNIACDDTCTACQRLQPPGTKYGKSTMHAPKKSS